MVGIEGPGVVADGPVVGHQWFPAELVLARGAMPSGPGAFLAWVPASSLSCGIGHPSRGQNPTIQPSMDNALSKITAPPRMTTLGTSPANGCQGWKTSVKMNQFSVIEHRKSLSVELRMTLTSPNELHKSWLKRADKLYRGPATFICETAAGLSFFGVWLEVARHAAEVVFCSMCGESKTFVVLSILVEMLLAIGPQLWVRSPAYT